MCRTLTSLMPTTAIISTDESTLFSPESEITPVRDDSIPPLPHFHFRTAATTLDFVERKDTTFPFCALLLSLHCCSEGTAGQAVPNPRSRHFPLFFTAIMEK